MSTWQLFSDADNNYRWQINSDDTSNLIKPPTPPIPTSTLPSMYNLLLHASTSHLFQPQDDENAMDDSFGFSNSLFKTASGRKVTISPNGIVRAKTLLGLGLNDEIVSSDIQTPLSAKKFNGFDEELPRLKVIDSCKKSSSVSFQSPLVSRLRNGFEDKIVQPDSACSSVKQAPVKFQSVVSDIQTPQNVKKFNVFDEESPHLQSMDSCKTKSVVSFQSPLVGRLKHGFENKIVQPDSGSVSCAKQVPSKFQTIGHIQTPQNVTKFNAFDEESPHLQLMDSCKATSVVSFQSPLVGRLKNGFESTSVQPDSGLGGGAKQSSIKFQTAGGRSLSISRDALKRARSLLGDPDLGDFFDGGDSLFSFPDKRQTNTIISSVERSESNNTQTPLLHQMTPESNHNHMKKSFKYPLQPSKQMEFSNKLPHEGNGNNLIRKFDDAVNESDCGRKSSSTPGQKPLYNKNDVVNSTIKSSSLNGFSSRMGSRGKPLGRALVDISNTTTTINTNNKQPSGGKRRLGLNATVSSFKKPRISNISASGDQVVQKFPNDLSQLSSGASGCKRNVSTRYPFRYPRMHIKEFFAVPPLEQKLHFPNQVRQVTSGNAGKYIFNDGSDDSGTGAEAFVHLLAQHGASLHFASKEWVLNHYKWIVWKLACYERCYPARCAGKFLTVSNVLEELKYRYEREVNHGHRSTIKKILEGDGLPSSMMTLCISSVHSDHVLESGTLFEAQTGNQSTEAVKVELTDGWYSINAILDVPLSKQLATGRLFVGQKLRIWGAGLCGWNGPVSPLEVSSTVSLFLHMNGTYRAHWADRLGFCKVAGPPLAFKCIKSNGGLVPQTLAGITRIYPILYKERLSSGRSVVISERMEDKMMELHNQRRSAIVDNIVSEYQKERTGSHIYDYGDSEGAKIYKMLETAAEPEFLMADMSPEQLNSFAAYKAKLNATRQSQMESSIEKALKDSGLGNREVTPFMRLRVVGLTYKTRREKPKEGIVTIWNPTQKQRQELVEGEAYAIAGLTPSGSDSDVLHLQTRGSTTKWLPLSSSAKEQFKPFFSSRKSIPLSSLSDIPLSNEFDIAAFVVHVGEVYTSNQQKKQWVFVTDGSIMHGLRSEKLMDTLLAICFCSPLIDHDSFPPINYNLAGSTVGFCNLIKKEKDHTNHVWVADANENSTYYLKFDSLHCSHLQNAASSVTRWASESSLIMEKLKENVFDIIGDCKA
ncbi:protein BREAST CANCER SUSCEPTIBILITY 2 homolog A-like [Trifolium pratense]|uniref:protein BREAST CANCER SUSCEPTIBILITY 2 homolog A-like n=1 Tax=Trifolium pratense TaxID=57577 RepID=UPI001E6923E6|nr:protein BREAST CANCER SUSCEPTIBILITY 2 homolog A-like [Trifolium pratense]